MSIYGYNHLIRQYFFNEIKRQIFCFFLNKVDSDIHKNLEQERDIHVIPQSTEKYGCNYLLRNTFLMEKNGINLDHWCLF